MDLDEGTVAAADDTESTPEDGDPGPHDHAWRRVRADRQEDPLRLGEYRCDLCEQSWSL